MSGEAFKVHDEVMAALKGVEGAVKAIRKLSSAWGDVERHRYLEEHLVKLSLAVSALSPAEAELRDLFNKINRASTTPAVARLPKLRVVR